MELWNGKVYRSDKTVLSTLSIYRIHLLIQLLGILDSLQENILKSRLRHSE